MVKLIGRIIALIRRLFWVEAKQLQGAIVDNVAYWQDKEDWFKAPTLNGTILFHEAIKIDLDSAEPQELYLLMRILEATNEYNSTGEQEV